MRRCCIWRCCGGRARYRPGPWPGSCGGTAAASRRRRPPCGSWAWWPRGDAARPGGGAAVYQRADVAERLEHSKAFQALTRQVEVKLGKKLTTPDVGILLGLTDYLGLPEGVVYLLVCHCVERVQRRFGEAAAPA